MNKILRLKSIVTVLILSAFIYSCSSDSNDDIMNPGGDDTPPVNAELIVTETSTLAQENINVTGGAMGEDIKVNVKFTSTSTSMRRLYITQNVAGLGEEPFQLSFTGVTVDEKKDGSLDLDGDNKNDFDFLLDFPAPNSMTNGTIVYKIWATSGRGDFRDLTKRNVFEDNAVGTITVTFGNGTNVANGMKTFSDVKLVAPALSGQTQTFFSLLTGETYKINQYDEGETIGTGEDNRNKEFVEIWDFGYYYGQNNKATIASTFGYELPGVDISAISGVPREDFNMGHFKKSTLTAAQFDAINGAADINTNVTVTTTDPQLVTLLGTDEGNNVLEFVDKYGKKGLMKVTQLVPGFAGDSSDFIIVDIKVQN